MEEVQPFVYKCRKCGAKKWASVIIHRDPPEPEGS